jgi:hypothetical protein
MEDYLKIDYNVIEFDGLTSADDIVPYFEDMGHELLDCGQGYFQDEAIELVKIGDKFFEVTIIAEVYGDKQDRGDRLYYVDHIKSVTYKEIPKPEPKKILTVGLEFSANRDIIDQLEAWLKDKGFTDYRWRVVDAQLYNPPSIKK